jgi:peptide-methionine (R)-S-oxide reductase
MINKPEEQWRAELTPEQYHVLREGGTEPPFTGELLGVKDDGVFKCAACGAELFSSDAKYDSGSGWPSFFKTIDNDAVVTELDLSHGMRRIEAKCANCGGHLGHVFPDGPQPTGDRWCINSAALKFEPDE